MVSEEFERNWFVFQRISEIQAAKRINVFRAIAVIVFFGIVVFRFANSEKTDADYSYIFRSGRICGIWMMLVAAIAIGLYRRTLPNVIKFLTTICDTVLLTSVAGIGQNAESTLVVVYFIIIACSFLRFSKLLIFFTTAICVVAYLVLVFKTPTYWEGAFPYVEVFRMVAGLIGMGIIGGQLCRSCRKGILQAFEGGNETSE